MRLRKITFTMALLLGVSFAQDSTKPEDNSTNNSPTTNSAEMMLDGMRVYRVCGKSQLHPCATVPPKAIHSPSPRYSKEARKQKIEGTAVFRVTVGVDGILHDINIERSIGYGLDEEGINALKKWKFKPATMDGQPVPVRIAIEVEFRLYG